MISYTRAKVVNGIKGRTWTVRRTLMREVPAGEDEPFEHDVDGGRIADMLILSTLALLLIILLVWSPDQVHFPWWLTVPVIVTIMFFGVRWMLRLPWKVVADTQGDYDDETSAETWVGTVRGVTKAREEVRMITRAIRKEDSPEYIGGVLKKQV